MSDISVQGVKINYISGDEFKEPRPTILMIHGAGQSSATWEYQVDAFRSHPGFNLVIPDLPGRGKSQGSGCKSIEEYSNFIKDLADALGLDRLVLVGHSMGGGVALVFTLNFPQRVYACVFVGTGARLRVAGETLLAVKNNYETFCEISPVRSFSSTAPEGLKRKFKEGLRRTPQEVSYRDLIACNEFDVMDKVNELEVPVLIVSGTEDILTPLKYGEYLNQKIRGSMLHVIKGAGHFMMQEKPDEFNRVLLEFLDSL
jgi:pimeloyl-ACP methyl ester carboxylesterase